MVRWIAIAIVALLALAAFAVWGVGRGWLGEHEGPGRVHEARRAPVSVSQAERRVHDAAVAVGVARPKQILFGDLHVHTTFSFDAFTMSLPVMMGEGSHPPADACDFARWCSALDFWSINDHAEGISPANWRETVDSIRECNAVAGDGRDPDTVAFLGWEWTQIGATPEEHYGHKNVVLEGLADDEIPTRPIAAAGQALAIRLHPPDAFRRGLLALSQGQKRWYDFARYFTEREGQALCDPDTPERDLPPDCLEVAETPAELFRKLDDWGFASIVIPHGTTWGLYTPPGSTWAKQLRADMHDPARQKLIEVYSGHGDSEVYRPWRGVVFDADGKAHCPEPSHGYLPSCWRAGEIIEQRCLAEGDGAQACAERAARTRQLAAEAGGQAHLVVDGESPEDWLDAGQCNDCDQPAFNYRPGGSAQYIEAVGNFEGAKPRHFRLGFIASSDNHFARPGTGYKERFRRGFTESNRIARPAVPGLGGLPRLAPSSAPRPFDRETTELAAFQLVEFERQTSFFMTGGLVAVHAEGRDRRAIWDALQRREVYGTTGPRILLWFELLNPPGSKGRTLPMGGEAAMDQPPIFQARAVGSFAQKPGCPQAAEDVLGPDGLERLCKGECYNPSDQRRRITRIEVVRIRPQREPGEDVSDLIDDPWQSFDCEPDPAGCAVTFADPEFPGLGRDALYYVRAYEEPKMAINAGGLRCDRDASGRCTQVHLCPGPEGDADDCLSEEEPRAWSSPIYVDRAPSAALAGAAGAPAAAVGG